MKHHARLAELTIDRASPHERPTGSRTLAGITRPRVWLLGVVVSGAFVAMVAVGNALPGGWWRGTVDGATAPAALAAVPAPSAMSAPPAVSAPPAAAGLPDSTQPTSVLDATGYVVARRQATVSATVTGKVLAVYVEEGMAVAEGQLLAQLDDSIPRAELDLAALQAVAARAVLKEIEVSCEQALLDFERTRELAVRKLASAADLDRNRLTLEASQARLNRARKEVGVAEQMLAIRRQLVVDMEIRAPFAGVVVAKAAQPGEMISPISAGGGFTRTGILSLVDMESLEVEVDVNEAFINRITPAQPVAVHLTAYPGHAFPAEVIAIIPTADRNKATVRVRIGLLERDERVLPDMGVRVAFLSPGRA